MRVLLAGSGSRGDVQPLIALAVGLRAAGHDAVVAARPAYGHEAADLGVPFEAVGMDAATFIAAQGEEAGAVSPRVVSAFLEQEIDAQLERLPALAAGADRVIGAGMSFGARSAAEARGVPFLAIVYTPNVLTAGRPRLPEPLEERVRRWRALRGLDPLREDLMRHAHPPERALLAADPELSGALDVPLWKPATGALLLDDPRPLSAEIEAFLAAGAPPVYIGFGSMAGTEPALGLGLVREAVEAAGCRALVVAAAGAAGAAGGEDRILVIGAAPHSRLFPRVAAVVHHGGAGTTAAAARAGVPQVILPHAFDQPLWAARAHRLGIAPPPIPARRVDAVALAAALRASLDEPRFRERARELGAALAARRGVDNAVAHVTGDLP